MALFKTKRQARYNTLKRLGFLPFEARALSKVSFKVPYMRGMIKDRRKALRDAVKLKWSKAEWKRMVLEDIYDARNYYNLRTGKPDPWVMLRAWEDRFKEKYPEYESPWQKKKRVRKDFIEKFDRGEQKYPRGRVYR